MSRLSKWIERTFSVYKEKDDEEEEVDFEYKEFYDIKEYNMPVMKGRFIFESGEEKLYAYNSTKRSGSVLSLGVFNGIDVHNYDDGVFISSDRLSYRYYVDIPYNSLYGDIMTECVGEFIVKVPVTLTGRRKSKDDDWEYDGIEYGSRDEIEYERV